ncbi:hypothetical protein MJO29_003094 [Puccinia striiformis f. sp. tritici]|nr:hypothetical protein MJO29_003094 [Puccinia striiformis f. sp. tritici]
MSELSNTGKRDIDTKPISLLLFRGLDPTTSPQEIFTTLRLMPDPSCTLSSANSIQRVIMIRKREGNQSHSFAFVHYITPEVATVARSIMSSKQFFPHGVTIGSQSPQICYAHLNSLHPIQTRSKWSFPLADQNVKHWDKDVHGLAYLPLGPPTPSRVTIPSPNGNSTPPTPTRAVMIPSSDCDSRGEAQVSQPGRVQAQGKTKLNLDHQRRKSRSQIRMTSNKPADPLAVIDSTSNAHPRKEDRNVVIVETINSKKRIRSSTPLEEPPTSHTREVKSEDVDIKPNLTGEAGGVENHSVSRLGRGTSSISAIVENHRFSSITDLLGNPMASKFVAFKLLADLFLPVVRDEDYLKFISVLANPDKVTMFIILLHTTPENICKMWLYDQAGI